MKSRIWFSPIFVAGLFLTIFHWPTERLQSFPVLAALLDIVVPKVGEALMIAVILALVVDYAAKQELLKDFAHDVSAHIVGRLLPHEFREYILGFLKADFIRDEWDVRYTIESWPDYPDYLRLTTFSSYVIENRSASIAPYTFEYEVEKSAHPEIGESKIIHVRLQDEDRLVFDTTGEVQVNCDDRTFKFASAPHLIRPKSKVSFLSESIECFSRDYSGEFVSRIPCLRTRITVLYPKEKLAVGMDPSFEAKVDKTELANGTEWLISSPMLPGHTFTTYWSAKRAKV